MNRLSLALAILLAACEDPHNFGMTPDAAIDPMGDGGLAGPQAVVVSGDFGSTGILSKLDVDTLTVSQNLSPAGGVSGDPFIQRIGDKVYVINRYLGNSISVYDARTLRFIEQYGTGQFSNPNGLVVIGDFMYVVTSGNAGAVKLKLDTGALTTLDLATALGEPDGNPDCVSIYAVGAKVFVACTVYDFSVFAPRGPGKVAIIDTANGDAITSVTLPFENPQNYFVRSPETSVFAGDLLIGLSPSFSDFSTGCIARVSTGASPSATCAAGLDNSEIGGVLTHMDVAPDGTLLWLAISTVEPDFSNPTGTLRAVELASGTLRAATSPPTQLITDVAACPDGSVVAADRTLNAAGLRVYKDNAERTTAALAFGLPPLFGNNTLCYDASKL